MAPDGLVAFAPSYDHGNSLGFNLLDEKRRAILDAHPPLSSLAAKACADRFADGKQVTLVDYAKLAISIANVETGRYWLNRIAEVSSSAVAATVEETPQMSVLARRFSIRLLETNRERLLS